MYRLIMSTEHMSHYRDEKLALQNMINDLFHKIDKECEQHRIEKDAFEKTKIDMCSKVTTLSTELANKQESIETYHRVSFVANLNKQITDKDKIIQSLNVTNQQLKSKNEALCRELGELKKQFNDRETLTPEGDAENEQCENVNVSLPRDGGELSDQALQSNQKEQTITSHHSEVETRKTNDNMVADTVQDTVAHDSDKAHETKTELRAQGEHHDSEEQDQYYDIVMNEITYTCNKKTNKVYIEQDGYLVAVGRITSKGELKLKKKKSKKK